MSSSLPDLITPPRYDFVTFGETMALFIAQEIGEIGTVSNFSRQLAGAESNVAIGLARLGLRVAWISRLGDDTFGRYLRGAIQSEGVDVAHVSVDSARKTGLMFKSKTGDGSDPVVEYYRAGSAASAMSVQNIVGVTEADPTLLAQTRFLHMTGILPALSPSARELTEVVLRTAKKLNKTICFDPNLRPRLWANLETMRREINLLASLADWVLPGIGEGRQLSGYQTPEDIARFYMDLGVRGVVIKLGTQGAYFKAAAGEGYVAAIPVKTVVDTVGAGDGFAVGTLSGLALGLPIRAAVERGVAIGARVVQFPGDVDGLPTATQLASESRVGK